MSVNIDFLAQGPQTLAYNSDGTLATISVVIAGRTHVITLSYNASGQLTGVSEPVPQ